jgi:anti-anti-sigma regulatory factor
MLSIQRILVPDVLDHASIKTMLEQINTFVDSPTETVIEVANVKRVSTAALQFMLAVSKQIRLSGGIIVLNNPSETFSNAVVLLGLEREFTRNFSGWTS